MKEIFSRSIKIIRIAFTSGILLAIGLTIFYNLTKSEYSSTPYGMMVRDKCDPEETYFEMILAAGRYYVPFSAFNQILVADTARYKKQIYLGYVYPELGFEILEAKTPEERNKKIGVMINDRSVVTNNADMFSFFIKNSDIQKTDKILNGYILYDDKNTQNYPEDHINTSIYYLDPEWKDGISFITCSRKNNGCTMYVDKGRLSYLIDFRKEMLPDIQHIRDQIIQKVEGYKTKPIHGFMLPEEYSNMGGKFQCQN